MLGLALGRSRRKPQPSGQMDMASILWASGSPTTDGGQGGLRQVSSGRVGPRAEGPRELGSGPEGAGGGWRGAREPGRAGELGPGPREFVGRAWGIRS